MPNGYVVYKGPSLITGDEILAIAVGFNGSQNSKTGSMVQLYLLNSNLSPIDAMHCGANTSICGNCPMKKKQVGPKTVGACYVNLGQAPTTIWKSYKKGLYPTLPSFDLFKGKSVRLGAYGDPTALPITVIKAIASHSFNWTGYTHHWWNPLNQAYKEFCVASCDGVLLMKKAKEMGWDTFRHKAKGAPLLPGEIICPSETEGIQCIVCGLCNGRSGKHIVIDRHGSSAHHFKERI